ncbi:predicted outer membrane protein [Microbacterium testaceum StLB037]|uniref:Predicted outer membrane protein n=1 Tax=Microbacterium testaceum (strain StLB037) TaxID=979556 RepID=E8N6M9_MICTS|nr:predicted outer membrane protein [Microbacterium testaceum StLB037]
MHIKEKVARAVLVAGLSLGLTCSGAPASASEPGAGVGVVAATTVVPAAQALSPVRPASIPSGVSASLTCAPQTLYAVSSSGQMRRIANGAVSTVGAAAQGITHFNGLGIGADGKTALAFDRSSTLNTARIYYFDGSRWVRTTDSYTNTSLVSFVAGAIDLSTGDYYLGGFTSDSRFLLTRYVPSTGAFTLVGSINAPTAGSGTMNGDMAFDARGNLYLVASNSSTTVLSVTAASLAAASGGLLPSSQSFSFTTAGFAEVNGVAFNNNGSMFLGSSDTVREYDTSTGTLISVTATGLSGSTDLASCNSPANLTLRKNVASRAAGSDQFALSVAKGSTVSGTATTTGSATGIQADQIGPLPVLQGATYTLTEQMAPGSTSPIATYASSLSCVDETGAAVTVSSESTVTIPNRSGASVECAFVNRALTASVTVHKVVQDIRGQDARPGSGWTLGAATTFTTGSGTASPSATTQVTPASGSVSWQLAFEGASARGEVKVSEQQQSGWEFVSGVCTIARAGGGSQTVPLAGPSGVALSNIAPGDAIDCTLTNKPVSGLLTLKKQVDNTYGGSSTPADWTLTGAGPQAITGKTGESAITSAVVAPGSYALSESGTPAGYQAGPWSCTGGTVTGASVSVAADADVVCTITNASKPGSVAWTKTSEATGDMLSGSEWTVSGPSLAAPDNVVVDCIASPCTGLDKDPTPGAFRLDDLAWGSYTATETRAPVGYIAAGSLSFTVTPANAGTTQDLGPQTNEQQSGARLPLTGGVGADAFVISGFVVLLGATASVLTLRLRSRRSSR